jgi:hypothetical protein
MKTAKISEIPSSTLYLQSFKLYSMHFSMAKGFRNLLSFAKAVRECSAVENRTCTLVDEMELHAIQQSQHELMSIYS